MSKRVPILALLVEALHLAAGLAPLVTAERAYATFPGKNGKIAFSGSPNDPMDSDYEIYTLNADGSDRTKSLRQ